jgi:UDP-N-acetylglucosamine 3-dehydrogenase
MGIKVGVVGLGYMGSAHARVYSQLKGCELVGVCDTDSSKKHLAEKYQCKFFERIEDFLKENLDAVSICTPTTSHKKIALKALNEGKHVLIEKPLATTVEDAEKILEARKSEILAVGFIERFNPAVGKLREIVDFCDIYSTVSLRFGPYPPRIKDIGVLLDVASHEIDTLSYLTGTEPEVVYAYTSNHLNNGFEDYAYLSLKCGHIHSHIETSWLPTYKLRLINLYGNESFYSLNYAQQKIKFWKAPPQVKIDSGSWHDILRLSGNVNEDVSVSQMEPLELELKCFIESIRKGEILDPLCSCEEGLSVLRIVKKSHGICAR